MGREAKPFYFHAQRALLAVVSSAALAWPVASQAQFGAATSAGVRSDLRAARDRTRMHALQRHAQTGGGCNQPLPAGWASLTVTVSFPAEYAGYPGWVNSAELLPDGSDIEAYVNSSSSIQPPGTLVRPARHGGMMVQTDMCAQRGRSYWLVVDSGTAKVLVGRVSLANGPGPYQFSLNAPPLHR